MLIEHLQDKIFRIDGILADFDDDLRGSTICLNSRKLNQNTYHAFKHLVTQSNDDFTLKYKEHTLVDRRFQEIFKYFPDNTTSIYMVFLHNKKRYIEKGTFISLKHDFSEDDDSRAWTESITPGEDEEIIRKRSYVHIQTTIPEKYLGCPSKRSALKETQEYIDLQTDFRDHILGIHKIYNSNGSIAFLRKFSNKGGVGAFLTIQEDTLNRYIKICLPTVFAALKEIKYKNRTITLVELLKFLPIIENQKNQRDLLLITLTFVKVGCRDDNGLLLPFSHCRGFMDSFNYFCKVLLCLEPVALSYIDYESEQYYWCKHMRTVFNDLVTTSKNLSEVYMLPDGSIVVESATRYKSIQLRNIVDKLDSIIKSPPISDGIFSLDEFYEHIFSEFLIKSKLYPGKFKITKTSHIIADVGQRCVVYTSKLKQLIEESHHITDKQWIAYAEGLIKAAATTVFLFTDGNMRQSAVRTLKIGGSKKNMFLNAYMLCIIDDYIKSNKDKGVGKHSLNILIDGAAYKTIYCLVIGKTILLHIHEKKSLLDNSQTTYNVVLDNVNTLNATSEQKKSHLRDYAFSLFNGGLVDIGDCLKGLQLNIVDSQRLNPSTFRQLKVFVQKLLIAHNIDGDPYHEDMSEIWETLMASKNGHSRETFMTEYGTNGIDPKRFGFTQMSHYGALGMALYLGSHFIDDYWSHTTKRKAHKEIEFLRDELIKRNAMYLDFSAVDNYMINRLYHTSNNIYTDQWSITLADVLSNVNCRYREMKVMVNAMYSSLMKDEMLFFECSTGSGKTFTTIDYIKYICDNSTYSSFLYIVPYSSLQSEVSLKMNEKGLTVGGFDEIFNKIPVDVYVLKYSDIPANKIKSIGNLNTSWFTNIRHIFFDESHILLTDGDFRDSTDGFPLLMEATSCSSVIMLSATLGSMAKRVAKWFGYKEPTFYDDQYNTYVPSDINILPSIPKNTVTKGASSYYKLVDKSKLGDLPIGRVAIPGPASLVKTVLSFINISLKGLVFMSSKREVLNMAVVLSSIFGFKRIGVIMGTSTKEYLDICLVDPEIKILIGTTSCTTGLNLGVEYIIIADVSPSLCNIYQTYQLLGRIREENVNAGSFIVDVVSKKNENKSVLKILENNFHSLMNREFPTTVKNLNFDVKRLDSISLPNGKLYSKKTDWYSKKGLYPVTEFDTSMFESVFYGMYYSGTYMAVTFDGFDITLDDEQESSNFEEEDVYVEEDEDSDSDSDSDHFVDILKNHDKYILSKVQLKDIKKDMLNINSGVWFTMTGLITGKDLITGLYGFMDGTKPDEMFQNFDTLISIAESSLVEYTDYQRRGSGKIRFLDEVPIPLNYSVCLNVESSDLETHTLCYNYREGNPVTIIGKLQLSEDEKLVFTNVSAYRTNHIHPTVDLSSDTFALTGFDEEQLTFIKHIDRVGRYMVKGILTEVKRNSSFLFFDGTPRKLFIGSDVWDLTGYKVQIYENTYMNNHYCIPISKSMIHFEGENIGVVDYEEGVSHAVVMLITIGRRFGSLCSVKSEIQSMYQI